MKIGGWRRISKYRWKHRSGIQIYIEKYGDIYRVYAFDPIEGKSIKIGDAKTFSEAERLSIKAQKTIRSFFKYEFEKWF